MVVSEESHQSTGSKVALGQNEGEHQVNEDGESADIVLAHTVIDPLAVMIVL